MNKSRIEIPKERIADFCRRLHIRKISLFDSVLRYDFRKESDVEVLVEFEAGHVPGFKFIGLQRELSELAGRRVDLNTPQCLSRYFRDEVIADAKVQYEAGYFH